MPATSNNPPGLQFLKPHNYQFLDGKTGHYWKSGKHQRAPVNEYSVLLCKDIHVVGPQQNTCIHKHVLYKVCRNIHVQILCSYSMALKCVYDEYLVVLCVVRDL